MQIACTYIQYVFVHRCMKCSTLDLLCALIHLIVHHACHMPFHCTAPTAPLNLTFPPGSVLNVSITLIWLSPQHPSGVIQFYELQQSSSAGDIFLNTTDNTPTVVLSNLSPGTQYNFSMRAFTVAFGPFSAQLSVHTADGEDAALQLQARASTFLLNRELKRRQLLITLLFLPPPVQFL